MVGYRCGFVDDVRDWKTAGCFNNQISSTSGNGNPYVRKSFAALLDLALVRFLAGMSPQMDSQGTSLDEALIAHIPVAMVGALVGVNPKVSLEI